MKWKDIKKKKIIEFLIKKEGFLMMKLKKLKTKEKAYQILKIMKKIITTNLWKLNKNITRKKKFKVQRL